MSISCWPQATRGLEGRRFWEPGTYRLQVGATSQIAAGLRWIWVWSLRIAGQKEPRPHPKVSDTAAAFGLSAEDYGVTVICTIPTLSFSLLSVMTALSSIRAPIQNVAWPFWMVAVASRVMVMLAPGANVTYW